MGRELVTKGSPWAQNALNDAILSEVIRKRLSPTSTAVDIGAAHGRFTKEMARVSSHGAILAIEPVPSLNAQLQRIFRNHATVSVLEYAIGKEDAHTDFWVCAADVGLSGLTETKAARDKGDVHQITVQVKTLDSVTKHYDNIDFIKIDVEGGEFDVLLGGQETLTQHQPIVAFECATHTDQYATSPSEIFRLLTRLGYKIFDPIAFLRGGRPLPQQYFCESVTGGHEFFFFGQHTPTSPRFASP